MKSHATLNFVILSGAKRSEESNRRRVILSLAPQGEESNLEFFKIQRLDVSLHCVSLNMTKNRCVATLPSLRGVFKRRSNLRVCYFRLNLHENLGSWIASSSATHFPRTQRVA